jgi:hypothetical protein
MHRIAMFTVVLLVLSVRASVSALAAAPALEQAPDTMQARVARTMTTSRGLPVSPAAISTTS